MAIGPEDTDDPLFVRGREAGEEHRLRRCLTEFRVRHFLHVAAQQHGVS
jgi:hypothetical protein